MSANKSGHYGTLHYNNDGNGQGYRSGNVALNKNVDVWNTTRSAFILLTLNSQSARK